MKLKENIKKEFKEFLVEIDRPYENADYETFVENLAEDMSYKFEDEYGEADAFTDFAKFESGLESIIKQEFNMDEAYNYWLDLEDEWNEDEKDYAFALLQARGF